MRPPAGAERVPTLRADWKGHDRCARGYESRLGRGIARILHPDAVSGIGQDPREKIERRLGAVGDHHLVRLAAHAPRRGEITRNRQFEGWVACNVLVAEYVIAARLKSMRDDAPKRDERKCVTSASPG